MRGVLTLNLKDDPAVIEAYRHHHAHVWPEVADSLRRSGIVHLEIYLLGRRLVMIADTDGRDIEAAFRAHHASAGTRVAAWEALMQEMQEPLPEAAPGEWWARMTCVCRL